jgi:hypothetical protein
MEERIIISYTQGKYGYKSFFELQRYNPVYKRYYVEHESIELTYIESYCVMHGIEFSRLPIKSHPINFHV